MILSSEQVAKWNKGERGHIVDSLCESHEALRGLLDEAGRAMGHEVQWCDVQAGGYSHRPEISHMRDLLTRIRQAQGETG